METFKRLLAVGTISTLVLTGFSVTSQAAVKAPGHTSSLTAHVVKPKTKKVAFKGTYTGNIALLWASSSVTASIATGTGTGTYLGHSTLSGKGSSATSNYCDQFLGSGSLSGGGSKLSISVPTSPKTQACVPSGTTSGPQSPPTTVTLSGVAKVLSGTGKWKGASGNLSFHGSFAVHDSTSGTNETDAFTVTLTGTLTIKK